ncbi:MAG TPA: class I SAM-dependent methyltransferase [Acetobacteraceae bacterium]|nr:class I SAM-dependent methyltransferase [Acetobacteraceae bacterium]
MKQLVPWPVRRSISAALYLWSMPNLPDRRCLVSDIIPYVCSRRPKRVLFVGCRNYTARYPRMFARHGVEVWTIDIDPQAARWGAPGHHLIGDASALDALPQLPEFECIIFNGILGFGIDDPETVRRTFAGFSRVLPVGALLVIGWDTDRTADPLTVPDLRASFDGLRDPSVPARISFDNSPHVYDILVRNKASQAL